MSDLFKDHKPELTEEEDRLLWQRVRAIPSAPPAPVAEPWWRKLFAMPVVRYGAPAFAVLIAATLYVVQQAPEPTLRVSSKAAPAPREEASPPVDAPTVTQTTPTAEQAAPESRRIAASAPVTGNEAGTRMADERVAVSSDAVAPAKETEGRGQTSGFAEPPSTTTLQKAPPPPPAATSAPASPERQEAVRERAATATAPQATMPAPAPKWGETKSQYLGQDPRGSLGVALPSRTALASHALVVEAAGPGALSGSVPLPDESGLRAVIALSPDAAPVARVESGSVGLLRDTKKDGEYERYEDAPARLQAAALAVAFERALASPATTPRAKVEKLLVRARAVAARDDATPGAARLVSRIENALRAWP